MLNPATAAVEPA